jgi:hypothetical protein
MGHLYGRYKELAVPYATMEEQERKLNACREGKR